jgi:dolichol-phosphate mannosyltransferase
LKSDPRLLSIVVPVYNEELNVLPLYEAVNAALAPLSGRYAWEFVFTDNCSSDNTFGELQKLAALDRRVRVFRFTRNFGFQRSILAGYRLAKGDAAVQIDCDLQDPPSLIPEFVRHWENGYRIVLGVRRSRRESALMTLTRKLFYRFIARISTDNLPPDAGDFRLIDRRVIDLLHLYQDENPYLRGYISALGYSQIGIAYDRAERRRGKSAFSLGSLISLALDGIVNHSVAPLRMASFLGLGLALVAIVGGCVYLGLWIFHASRWPAGFATLALLMLSSLAINAVLLGIIGEYLARIYRQVRPGPLAIVDQWVDHSQPGVQPAPESHVSSGIVFGDPPRDPR